MLPSVPGSSAGSGSGRAVGPKTSLSITGASNNIHQFTPYRNGSTCAAGTAFGARNSVAGAGPSPPNTSAGLPSTSTATAATTSGGGGAAAAATTAAAVGGATGTSTASLAPPAYIQEKRQKLEAVVARAEETAYHDMGVAVDAFKGLDAYLKESCDVIEGAVLALGVPTAHRLVTTLARVRAGLQTAQSEWAAVLTCRRAEKRASGELVDALAAGYGTVRDRNEALERDLRARTAEKDAENAALDEAARYVAAVVAEHAAWQDRHGYNALELPAEERSLSDKCVAADKALYAIRHAPEAVAATVGRVPPLEQDCAAPGFAPRSHLYTSQVDGGHTLAARWRSLEDARRQVGAPSVRLHYTPPGAEVELLRRVLAMGTASTTLLYDLRAEEARLDRKRLEIRLETARLRDEMGKLRKDLSLARMFLHEAQKNGVPFVANKAPLMDALNRKIEAEVERKVRSVSPPASAGGGAPAPAHPPSSHPPSLTISQPSISGGGGELHSPHKNYAIPPPRKPSTDPVAAAYWNEGSSANSGFGSFSLPFKSVSST